MSQSHAERLEEMRASLQGLKTSSKSYRETCRFHECASKDDLASVALTLTEAISLLMEAMEGEKGV